jgi:hypothetical protein
MTTKTLTRFWTIEKLLNAYEARFPNVDLTHLLQYREYLEAHSCAELADMMRLEFLMTEQSDQPPTGKVGGTHFKVLPEDEEDFRGLILILNAAWDAAGEIGQIGQQFRKKEAD